MHAMLFTTFVANFGRSLSWIMCTYGINSVDSIYIILFSIYTTVHMPGIIDWNIEIQILITLTDFFSLLIISKKNKWKLRDRLVFHWSNIIHSRISWSKLFIWLEGKKDFAPGEARTHGLQIMRLTRCQLRYRGYLVMLARK